MGDTAATLSRKIRGAEDLRSVVRTMKAVAATNIGQYESSVRALSDYYRSVEMGLGACLRGKERAIPSARENGASRSSDAVVFGSDQGLVGRFNDVVADFAIESISDLPGERRVWAVGERVHARLSDSGIRVVGSFELPTAVEGIVPLVGRILMELEAHREREEVSELHLFYNRSRSAAQYAPIARRILPLDQDWYRKLNGRKRPAERYSELIGDSTATLRALIDEYLFVSLFRACAESLESENASRLAAMQRADRNIDELLEAFNGTFHRMRKDGIDAELFDVIAAYDSLR